MVRVIAACIFLLRWHFLEKTCLPFGMWKKHDGIFWKKHAYRLGCGKNMMEYSGKHMLIVWDMDNKTTDDIHHDVDQLLLAIEQQFPGITVHINGFGDPIQLEMDHRRGCYFSSSLLIDIPKGCGDSEVISTHRSMINEMQSWAMPHRAPAIVLLVSKDANFICTMRALEYLRFSTMLAYYPGASELLRESVNFQFDMSLIAEQFLIAETGWFTCNADGVDLDGDVYVAPTATENHLYWDMDAFGNLHFHAYGSDRNLPLIPKRAGEVSYHTTYRHLEDQNLINMMMADMWLCGHEHSPPSNIVVVTAEERLASTVASLRNKGFNMVVCLPDALPLPLLRGACSTWLASPAQWRRRH